MSLDYGLGTMTATTTPHYQSIHQVARLYLQQFLRYFADKVEMPKITKGPLMNHFFKIYSKVNQVIYSSLPVYS